MEEIKAQLALVRQDVIEIKSSVQDLVKQTAVHNHILEQHHQRSTTLESQIEPIRDDFKFRQKLYTGLVGSGGLIGLVSLAYTLWSKYHHG